MDEKKLVINCAACDATEVSEEALAGYSDIQINTGIVAVSDAGAALLAKRHVSMNCASVVKLPDGTDIKVQNGKYTISKGAVPSKAVCLIINGTLTIEPETEDVIAGYAAIYVNGKLLCPRSMAGAAAGITVNGKTVVYPDGAVIMSELTLDNSFTLRAGDRLYFVTSRIVALDEKLNVEKLISSGARFETKEALISETLVENLAPLFSDSTKLTILPAGTVRIDDDAVLTDRLIRRYGGRLCIDGDLLIEKAPTLKVEYLNVQGTLIMPEDMDTGDMDMEYDELVLFKGRPITYKSNVTIFADMLEGDGVTVVGCAAVTIDESAAPDAIRAGLRIEDCARVECSREQRAAIEEVSRGTAKVSVRGEDKKDLSDIGSTVTINTSVYKF